MPRAAVIFKALADDTRLRILNLLRQRETCVCEIVDVLGVCQSKVSRHLATLKHASLVTCRREGPWVYYSLTPPDGDLSVRLMDWLWVAKDQIRNGVSDLEALSSLDRCDSVSWPQPHRSPFLRNERVRREGPAASCGAATMVTPIAACQAATSSVR